MSWSEHDIDNLFRNASSKKDIPPFQDSYFNEIEGLLPQEKKRKFFLFFLLPLGLISIIGLYFLLENKEIDKNKSTDLNSYSSSKAYSTSIQSSSTLIKTNYRNRLEINTATKQTSTKTPKNNYHYNGLVLQHKEKHAIKSLEKNEQIEDDVLISKKLDQSKNGTTNSTIFTINEDKRELTSVSELSSLEIGHNPFHIENTMNIMELGAFPSFKKKYLIFTLGAGMGENFLNSSSSLGKTYTTSIGVSYFATKNFWGLSAGLNILNFKTNDLDLNRQSKVYGLSSTKYAQEIDYKHISFIELPFEISKCIKNYRLSLGVSPLISIGSVVDFRKTQNEEEIVNTRIYGSTYGINNFSLNSYLSADIKLKPDLELGIKVTTFLINPLEINKFENNLNKNVVYGQLTLKKHLKLR